ncbi:MULTISPECIES: bifunctional aminoglycoside phosphotransferase/ATP-binding protein [Mameliella]|uniref:bifunctional aminoglycoside phosphotransferase/ATP-binding protein n=1 Tax=Mameliella TaxID=1434019 RepID=UPI000B52A439|nr:MULTISPECIES: bifunctional aminoglycoside phosphotransferase/ATP-binding protein [Mameliella]MCR9272246.1 AAA family ATPase [Paracoccaceae bacterium]OWV61683.1 kinase [Mameliella alba]
MADQEEVVTLLQQPALYAGAADVDVVRTHGAYVFLGGDTALKIKRAVRYDYLDYSTPELRAAALRRELELNAPAAPMIYRDMVAVTRGADGALALDGAGEVVEWALRMWRFADEDQLDRVAGRGALDRPLAETLGESIAQYHAAAPALAAPDGARRIGDILDELGREFAGMEDALPAKGIARFLDRAREALARQAALLDSRAEAGHVRRCHGDLHLRNIVLIEGRPVPFDALEFSEELGTCDVLYDLAFLLMDLRHRGLAWAANAVLNRYLFAAATDDHYRGLAALPLFQAVRAGISAMVAVQTARAQGGNAPLLRDAGRYLDDAIAVLEPGATRLVALGGLSGTGKTTVARGLAPDLGAPPGAVHLRSDMIRKALCGVDPLTPLDARGYRPEVSAAVYDRMDALAREVLQAGQTVIADAVFLNPDERAAIAQVAQDLGAGFAGLWLEAEGAALVARVSDRRGDASDADAEVVRAQLARDTGPIGWARVDASGAADEVLSACRAALGGTGQTPA